MEFDVISPKNVEELLNVIRTTKNFRFGAGFTDLLMEMKKKREDNLTIINLAQLKDGQFTSIEIKTNGVKVGSLVTVAQIVNNNYISKNFPVLNSAGNQLASPQIRQVATVGGNLCTASPSGDIACALVALKVKCEILSSKNKIRIIPISEFFTGPRKTVLRKDEILRSVLIPLNEKKIKIHSGFIKVGVRRSMECSVASLAYHLQMTTKDTILKSGISIGSVAPVIRSVDSACHFLNGKNIYNLSEKDQEKFAQRVLHYADPISDIRGSAWYRSEVLYNLCKSFLEMKYF